MAEVLSPSTQIEQNLELLSNQREGLLAELEIHPPGSVEFADIAQRLVSLKSQLETQSIALKIQQELDLSEAQRRAKAQEAAAAAAAAQAKRHAEALKSRDQLLSDWEAAASQLKSAICVWHKFVASDSYRVLSENERPGCAGAYSAQKWERLVPFCRRRPDGGWTLYLNAECDRG